MSPYSSRNITIQKRLILSANQIFFCSFWFLEIQRNNFISTNENEKAKIQFFMCIECAMLKQILERLVRARPQEILFASVAFMETYCLATGCIAQEAERPEISIFHWNLAFLSFQFSIDSSNTASPNECYDKYPIKCSVDWFHSFTIDSQHFMEWTSPIWIRYNSEEFRCCTSTQKCIMCTQIVRYWWNQCWIEW